MNKKSKEKIVYLTVLSEMLEFRLYWEKKLDNPRFPYSAVKRVCLQFLRSIEKNLDLFKNQYSRIVRHPLALSRNNKRDEYNIGDYIKILKAWGDSQTENMPFSKNDTPTSEDRRRMAVFFVFLTPYLKRKAFGTSSKQVEDDDEKAYLDNDNIPPQVANILNADIDFWKNVSKEDTIAVVADIRRSQNLMTYAESTEDYCKRITSFLDKSRDIIKNHNGIFDRFTGDGFVCYFSKYIFSKLSEDENANNVDYYDEMIAACNELITQSVVIFADWSKHVRKLTHIQSGLSIGVDSGFIEFSDSHGGLMGLGSPLVWATRLCDVGNKEEIVLNNIPYCELVERGKIEKCEERKGKTKTGEEFVGFVYKPTSQSKESGGLTTDGGE